jgi:hypothetical protein
MSKLQNFRLLLVAILFMFIGTQFIGPYTTTLSAASQPITVSDTTPVGHSTACDPLPWNRNPELAAMGYEIRNVWFTTESRDIFTQQSEVYLRTTEDLVLHFDIRRLHPPIFNSKLITKIDTGGSLWGTHIPIKPFAQYTDADWDVFQRWKVSYSSLLYESGLRFFLTDEWDGATAHFENGYINKTSWKNPKASEQLSQSFTPFQDYRYKVVVPERKNAFTIAIASGQEKLIFIQILREEFEAPVVFNNEIPKDLKPNCSTVKNPYPHNTVLTQNTWQVESLGTLGDDTVSQILSTFPNDFPAIPGKHYKIARFLLRNTSPRSEDLKLNEVSGHLFNNNSWFTAALLTNKGKAIENLHVWGNEVEKVLFPFATAIVHSVHLVPDSEKPSVIEICLVCYSDSNMNGAEKQFLEFSSEFTPIDLSLRDEKKTNKRTSQPVRIGETAFAKSYSLKINQLVYGYDAVKFLCGVSECSGEFLTKIDNFQRTEQVDFTLAKITLNLNDVGMYEVQRRIFNIENLSIRLVGKTRCKQLPYEVVPFAGSSTTRVTNEHSCRVSTPENIHGYNFPQFDEILPFKEMQLSGTSVTGWVRFWVPRRTGNKVIVIDPFQLDRVSRNGFWKSYWVSTNQFSPGCEGIDASIKRLWNTHPWIIPSSRDKVIVEQEFLCLPDGKVQSDDVVYFHYR